MDTVVYKIHNVKSYPIFHEALSMIKNEGKGKITFESQNGVYHDVKDWSRAYVNIARNLFFIEPYQIEKHISSSSNFITIRHDTQLNQCKIEFSIPKFIFGNNVVEIIPGIMSKNRVPGKYDMHTLAVYWLRIIKAVIKQLFYDVTFGAESVKFTDVEIARIDVTYNQIYPSMEDALFSLDAMKKVRLKKCPDTAFAPYDYGVTFNNPRYYFKIYHKGREFEKNGRSDLEKNLKVFKERKLKVPKFLALTAQHVDNLQLYADRVLRYELECKGGVLNYLFNQKLKKKYIPAYRELWSILNYLFDDDNRFFFRGLVVYYRDNLGQLSGRQDKVFYLPEFYAPAYLVGGSGSAVTNKIPLAYAKKIEKIYSYSQRLVNEFWFTKNRKNLFEDARVAFEFLRKEFSRVHSFFLEIKTPDAHMCSDGSFSHLTKDLDKLGLFDKTMKNQKFSSSLIKQCINVHNSFFARFQFNNLPADDSIGLQVRRLNEVVQQKKNNFVEDVPKIRKSAVVSMYRYLAEFGSMDALKKSGLFHRQTLWNWEKKIKKLNGTNANFYFKEFTKNYCRDIKAAYKNHYVFMEENSIPIGYFLNQSFIFL